MSQDTLPPSNKCKTPATPRQEESLSDSVLTLHDRINALENNTQKKCAVIESKISHIESWFTVLENGQAAINYKLDKFLDVVQAHMQQITAWIAAVTAYNPNIAVPASSPTPPPDNGSEPQSLELCGMAMKLQGVPQKRKRLFDNIRPPGPIASILQY